MLVELASTPVAAGLFFLYIKDKYEKEPWKMLFLGVLFGLYTAAVVYALGSFLEERFPHEETPFYTAFFSSAGVIYVTHPILGGYETALERALLSVPGHGLFGVRMGYYFALGKYRNRKRYLPLAFFSPYLAHALYNYFLLKREPVFWLFFSVLEVRLWVFGLKYQKSLSGGRESFGNTLKKDKKQDIL